MSVSRRRISGQPWEELHLPPNKLVISTGAERSGETCGFHCPRSQVYFEPSSASAIANNLLTVFQFRPVDAHCNVFSILTSEIFG